MGKNKEIIEEIEYNEGTDIEYEPVDEDADDIRKPWDPSLIRVDTKAFSLRNIMDMIEEGDLELAPDFQRNKVWKNKQKSRLIESILLRIPLPAFYFSSNDEGKMQVVDGLQRLSTIYEFVHKEGFVLQDLEYLKDEVESKSFAALKDSSWTRRLYNTQITVNVIDPQTPEKVKFDIFKRINTGGSPLNPQEIRHCMSGKRSRAFLKTQSQLAEFNLATGGQMESHVRMADREIILRFLAFRQLEDIKDYQNYDTVDDFLSFMTKELDTNLSEKELDTFARDFRQSMINAYNLFGENAFRKWPLGAIRKAPINRALFESWGNMLANYDWKDLEPHKDKIVVKSRQLMTNDWKYISAISSSTGKFIKVKTRFEKIKEVFNEIGL